MDFWLKQQIIFFSFYFFFLSFFLSSFFLFSLFFLYFLFCLSVRLSVFLSVLFFLFSFLVYFLNKHGIYSTEYKVTKEIPQTTHFVFFSWLNFLLFILSHLKWIPGPRRRILHQQEWIKSTDALDQGSRPGSSMGQVAAVDMGSVKQVYNE